MARVRAALANPECGWIVARGLRAVAGAHGLEATKLALEAMARCEPFTSNRHNCTLPTRTGRAQGGE